MSPPAGTGSGGWEWPGTAACRGDVDERELSPRAKRHRAAAVAAKREVGGDGPATLLLPVNLQVPLAGDTAPAWLTDYDAAFRGKRAELEAEDEAAAERRARVAAAAPKRTVYVGGEGKIYGPPSIVQFQQRFAG